MSRIRKLSAAVSAVALVGAGGLSAAQAATSTDAGPRGDRPSHRQGGPMPSAALEKIASQLGVTTAQLEAAMEATRPAKPAADSGPRDGMASEIAAALDVDVAKVRAILDANRPARPARGAKGARPAHGAKGARPLRAAKPSQTKLIAALASGLDIDTPKVKAALDKIEAAHKAEHATREAAMYSALATQLGVGADAVEAAFEANRPAHPAKPAA